MADPQGTYSQLAGNHTFMGFIADSRGKSLRQIVHENADKIRQNSGLDENGALRLIGLR